MRKVFILTAFALLVLAVGLLADYHARAMSNGAPALNCLQCHMGADKNPAQFVVEGLPSEYEPGKTYKITVKITKGPDCGGGAACGGFAVAVSAGQLKVVDSKHTFISTLPTGQKILTHSKEGSKLRQWTFEWVAPSKPAPVRFEVSVIAANGDGSFNGDAYAHKTITIKPLTVTAAPTTPKTTSPSPTVTTTTITTTITKLITETITTTTTSYSTIVSTKTQHSPGVAATVAALIFIIIVGAYLAATRR